MPDRRLSRGGCSDGLAATTWPEQDQYAWFDVGLTSRFRCGDALEKRRKLMDAWAAYCGTPPRAVPGAIP